VGVFVAPVLPGLTDSDAALDALLGEIAAAGAAGVSVLALHLRPGTREWFFAWLRTRHPELTDRYLDLYGHSAYAPKAYQNRIAGQVRELAGQHGVGRPRRAAAPGHRFLQAPRPPETPKPQWAAQPLTASGEPELPPPRRTSELSAPRKDSRSPEPPEQLTLL
jgi:hypothetical protein